MNDLQQRRRATGLRLITWPVVSGIIVISFVTTAFAIPAASWLSTAGISLACGVAALSLMAGSAILGGRWGWVEGAFGGLDRVYTVHKWLGIYALALASIHLLFKADLRGWDTAAILVLPSDWARLARQASLVGLMLIAVLALNRNISYGVWRWWHRLSGPIFVVVVVHWLSIKSPIVLASPAGLWLASLASLAVLAALWKLTLYPFLARHAEYRVVEVVKGGSAVQIDLLPTGRRIDFTPGQFGFLRMKAQGLREPHPFTIAAAGSDDGRLSFVIRSLGDFTARLVADVRVGMRAEVHAPFGRFTRAVGMDREIWVAGGVGIGFPSVERLQVMADRCGVGFVPVESGPTTDSFKRRFSESRCGVISQPSTSPSADRLAWPTPSPHSPRRTAFRPSPSEVSSSPFAELTSGRMSMTGCKRSSGCLPPWLPRRASAVPGRLVADEAEGHAGAQRLTPYHGPEGNYGTLVEQKERAPANDRSRTARIAAGSGGRGRLGHGSGSDPRMGPDRVDRLAGRAVDAERCRHPSEGRTFAVYRGRPHRTRDHRQRDRAGSPDPAA